MVNAARLRRMSERRSKRALARRDLNMARRRDQGGTYDQERRAWFRDIQARLRAFHEGTSWKGDRNGGWFGRRGR